MVGVATVGLFLTVDLSERGRVAAGLLANAWLEASVATAVALMVVKGRGGSLADLGLRRFPLRRLWWVAGFLLAFYVLITLYFALVTALGLGRLQPDQQIPEGTFDSALTVGAGFVAVVLVAPLAEELFFRGFVFGGLVDRLGVPGAAAASGLLFSLVHGQMGLILPFALIGVLLAYLYYRSGSLWPAVLAHLVYNGLAFAALNAAGGAV